MMKLSRLLAAALVLSFSAAAIAGPSYADGRKRPARVTAPRLRRCALSAPAPPVQPQPAPIKLVPVAPPSIVLPSNFGTGGVGIDINGGSGGGGRLIVISSGSARAQASATAFAFASASATSFAGGGGKGGRPWRQQGRRWRPRLRLQVSASPRASPSSARPARDARTDQRRCF